MKATTKYGRGALSAVAGLTMVASMAAAPALANAAAPGQTTDTSGTEAPSSSKTVKSSQVIDSKAEGTFTFDQTTITSNKEIATFFQQVSKAVCQATANFETENPLGWKLSVAGDVKHGFMAPVSDLASEDSVNQVMTCTCGGNPAGGRAIITADVKGIPIEYLLSRAGVDPGANTLTFVSSDGSEVSFPLGYVVGHHGVLSYAINDEDLSASVGGNNQLWMTKTPANYFVRDVVQIVVSTEETVPAVPGVDDQHPNSPNAGVLSGTQG